MRWLWIVCSIAVCVSASTAEAKPRRARTAKIAKPAAREKPAKPARAARAATKTELRKKPAVKGRAGKPEPRPSAKSRRDAELAALTADPRLSRADRVGGTEAPGMVAFTFDDGPSLDTTPAVVDALEKYDVPATFFIVADRLIGRDARQHRRILQQQLAAGFDVASHTYTHRRLKRTSPRVLRREVDDAVRTLSRVAGRKIGMFRAPFGMLDGRGRAWLRKRGLTEVRWSIDPADWDATDAETLRRATLATILERGGGIVLLHDLKEVTAQSLALVLDDLEAANCARLAQKQDPILPVSLHYWLRDNGKPRAIPDDVKKRTAAYRTALPGRCAARPKPVRQSDPLPPEAPLP